MTIRRQFDLLLRERRFVAAAACVRHEFSDRAADPAKRLRTHEVACQRCGVIVPAQMAFFYEQGLRHGAADGARERAE